MAGAEAEIDRLPVDLLAHIFSLIPSFRDLAQASGVCRKWKRAVEQSFARKQSLSFAGWKVDDSSVARLVLSAYNLKELDMYSFFSEHRVLFLNLSLNCSRSCWGCQITDEGLYMISSAKCVGNLMSISLWGMAGITDNGVIQLVSKSTSLQHLNIGGTFITDESLFAIANSCPHLKSIVLWSCRHVTENGLVTLVDNCRKLESITVWGIRVPVDCFISLLSISPALQIKPLTLLHSLPVS
ncbi:F-box protein [Apostasia shenzhenica]|uniref:F-box protein n=1 Tax=Apostasia shenzhenica TaxID=1088818 RepID=A0A2I0AQS5_9ASPA|nr:F-box protein [Apostasia shenzhenica]